ncbi:unnamed protein product [Zymoseptoria tritici ST99CH_1E4]|uniref:Uncharacterized protein n=1 Tax=Zymoseptoria tritici ST99CH_1E4 TaxID=1276532 RepID=A0A2H1H8K2_ZYMTR|nr:unnamed protein product [Zymoseptoria tritici ST99CH_1E4]
MTVTADIRFQRPGDVRTLASASLEHDDTLNLVFHLYWPLLGNDEIPVAANVNVGDDVVAPLFEQWVTAIGQAEVPASSEPSKSAPFKVRLVLDVARPIKFARGSGFHTAETRGFTQLAVLLKSKLQTWPLELAFAGDACWCALKTLTVLNERTLPIGTCWPESRASHVSERGDKQKARCLQLARKHWDDDCWKDEEADDDLLRRLCRRSLIALSSDDQDCWSVPNQRARQKPIEPDQSYWSGEPNSMGYVTPNGTYREIYLPPGTLKLAWEYQEDGNWEELAKFEAFRREA